MDKERKHYSARIADIGAALGMLPIQERERTPEQIEQDERALARLIGEAFRGHNDT